MRSMAESVICGHVEHLVADQMKTYGITRVDVDRFQYNGLRYRSLENAVAHAKRHNFRLSLEGHQRSDVPDTQLPARSLYRIA